MDIEIESLKQLFSAINRSDVVSAKEGFDPQIVRIESERSQKGGAFRGIAEVREHIANGRATRAEGTCEPEEFLVNHGRVVVYLHVRVHLQGSFNERRDALEWAGFEK